MENGTVGARGMTELEMLRAQAAKTEDESLESTRRMVQLANESDQVSAATMEQLASQGERLRRVDQNMDTIQEDVREAEHDLEYLERCCGCLPYWKRGKKIKPFQPSKPYGTTQNPNTHNTSARTQNAVPVRTQPNYNPSAIPGSGDYITKITGSEREVEMEGNLQHVAGVVTDLRYRAADMNQAIKEQNEILERVDVKTTHNQGRIAAAQVRAERIVGEKPKPQEESLMPSSSKLGFQAAKMMSGYH